MRIVGFSGFYIVLHHVGLPVCGFDPS